MLDRVVTFKHVLITLGLWVVLKAYVAYALVYKMSDYLSQAVRG